MWDKKSVDYKKCKLFGNLHLVCDGVVVVVVVGGGGGGGAKGEICGDSET